MIRPARPLSRRESEVARLAAQRTKDEAIAIIRNAIDVYRDMNVSSCVVTCEVLIGLLDERLARRPAVTEL